LANSVTANALTISSGTITSGNVNVTGYVNASANLVAPLVVANVSAGYVNATGQVNAATLYATTSANVGVNVQITTAGATIGNSTLTSTVGVTVYSNTGGASIVVANGTTQTTNTNIFAGGIRTTGSVNAASVYSTGVVNASSFTTTGAVNTGTLYATTSANVGANVQLTTSALTVGGGALTNAPQITVANSTGTSVINAASISTTTFFGNVIGSTANLSTSVNSALLTVGTAVIANANGVYTTGVVNATSHTVGTAVIANATGVYTTGVVNATSHTVGTNFIANAAALVHTGFANVTTSVNSALLTVGTAFTANATLVNATAINVVNRVNTATLYVTTSANVGSNIQVTTTGITVGNSTLTSAVNVNITSNTGGVSIIVSNGTSQTTNTNIYANGVVTTGSVNAAAVYIGGNTALTANTLSTQNKIINSGMTIDQRYEFNGVVPTNGGYMIDRWIYQGSGVGSLYVGSNDLNSAGFGYPASNITNALPLSVNAADTSLTGQDYYAFGQKIEGYDTLDLIDQTFTLGFWVYASRAGTYYISFRNNALTASYVTPYTINATYTWEYKTITISGGLYSTGYDWEKGNLMGVSVLWLLGLSSAATYTTASTNTWLSGNFIGTSSQTNLMQTTSDVFVITAVQLRLGSILPRWESRPYAEELDMCQRYYQKSYSPGVSVGTGSSTVGAAVSRFGSATSVRHDIRTALRVTMRASPTMTWYSTNSGTSARIYNSTTAADATVSTTNLNNHNSTGYVNLSAAPAINDILLGQWTAEAEL
jgi:hypothetical protein